MLPGGRHILSHDQFEAAVLRGAGWGVRVLPDEDGSWEANPPALPEFVRRDLRWLAGNLQVPGTCCGCPGCGRWVAGSSARPSSCSPARRSICCSCLPRRRQPPVTPTSPFPMAPALALTIAWAGALYAPKLLGYAEVALSPAKRQRYGGLARFACGTLAEFGFTLLLDAISVVAKTGAMLRLACGAAAGWTPQNRSERGVAWGEATRLLWPQTGLGVLVFAGFATAGWTATLWALPFAGGLLAAIPLCVLTADPRFGRWLRDRQIAAIPEEHPRGPRVPAVAGLALRPQPESD